MTDFANPENLPLEKLTIAVTNAGVVQNINGLDPYWVEKKQLTIYEKPPTGTALVIGALDSWRNKMDIYLEDLKWLLGLEHHRFWSTIIYHQQCMDMLVSFLQEANPPYLPPYSGKNVQGLYEEIRKLVLVVFSRLITNKESKSQWISKDYMRDLIYNKFIFTVPILWDICLVYGADNIHHVSKMISSVFLLQPKYSADLDAAIAFVKEAFKYITIQVNKDYDSPDPPNLPETFKGFSEIRRPPSQSLKDEKLTFPQLRDLVIHLLDTASTIRIFVEAYPRSWVIFKNRTFVLSIVQLYEHAIPHLYSILDEVGDETSVAHADTRAHIDAARAELVDVFRELLAVPSNRILNGEGSIESNVEDYLSIMMDGLSEKLLIKDYHACYPVNEDLEMLKQAYPNIDSVKTDFILQAIYSNLDEPIPEHILNNTQAPETNGHFETTDNVEPPPTDHEIPSHIREESLISEVRDILPHLGDGFILKCLQHYGFNSERVINSILEDNLDSSLKNLDMNLPIIPDDLLDNKFLETGISRLNVFDGDEFDIMTRDDVDVSRIHVGKKKSKYKDLKDMLDDKSLVKERTDIYTKYNLVCDETAMYSDEYDDTYDDDGAPPRHADVTADEIRRPFVTPRALAQYERNEESSEEEVEQPMETQASSSSNRNRMDFCMNPEELRARREASYRQRQGKGHRPPPKSSDVVGKAKGQGQEKDVLVNRERKEKNKSSRGNHSRRSGAQWKRSQGMMPS